MTIILNLARKNNNLRVIWSLNCYNAHDEELVINSHVVELQNFSSNFFSINFGNNNNNLLATILPNVWHRGRNSTIVVGLNVNS